MCQYLVENYCGRLTLVGEPFFEHVSGYVLPKGSPLTDPMNEAVLMLRQTNGLITAASRGQACNDPGEKNQVGMAQLNLFFGISYGGYFVILIIAFITRFRHRKKVFSKCMSRHRKKVVSKCMI